MLRIVIPSDDDMVILRMASKCHTDFPLALGSGKYSAPVRPVIARSAIPSDDGMRKHRNFGLSFRMPRTPRGGRWAWGISGLHERDSSAFGLGM